MTTSQKNKKPSWFKYSGVYIKENHHSNLILLICVMCLFLISAYILDTRARGPILLYEQGIN